MKLKSVLRISTLVLIILTHIAARAQTFGTNASAVWIEDCNQSDFYNTSNNSSTIGPAANSFSGNNFGSHTRNSGTLILRGAEVRTFKAPGIANVCSATLHYRVYLQSAAPGAFITMDLPFVDDCNVPSLQFPSGGSCIAGDQKWSRVIPDGTTTPYAPVDLTTLAPGNYFLEVYYDVTGSSTTTTLCNETVTLNNGGSNYRASFSIQSPVLISTNPTACNGTNGFIEISGLTAGATYNVSYADDGVPVGPLVLTADAAGKVLVSGLNKGVYSDFQVDINGCSTFLNTGLILSDPVFTPAFFNIAPFCAGSTPPTLPTTSNNGITGTWSPSVVNNMTSGSYTFTPSSGSCGLTVTKVITVKPNIVPTFTFGTSITICSGSSVPSLPNTSTNGINGTWSPATVSNLASGVYTFTPNPAPGQCNASTTLTVTVNPNVTPTFAFGSSQTYCAGSAVPALPGTSTNGITGSWSPATVDNQNSGVYTFTPAAGQCATAFTFTVTINAPVVPTFAFGSSLSICSGGAVPNLYTPSDNGITGTWSRSTVSNTASGTYTFTPTAGQCAATTTFSVTVTANITPTFSFGTSANICAGGTVPTLPNTSNNGVTGTWTPAVVDNQNSATYTFTPDAGQCATTTTFTVTISPNVTPVFSFGNSLTICSGAAVPTLPGTSANGITGTWSPASINNTATGTYTFVPNGSQCAVGFTLTVNVNPVITPTFAFGPSLTICSGSAVPALYNPSDNGITGSWSPSTVSNTASGTYTFTPGPGQCAASTSFSVTVTPNITPTFNFGTSTNICAGGTVPALTSTSNNGITGTWSPATVDNQNSATYTFTPDAGQCANTTTYTVTGSPNVTRTFSFGNSLTVCSGAAVPSLPGTSANGIIGTWSPATINNTISGTYTFVPNASQCAVSFTLTVTVNPLITPAFGFGSSLAVCAGAPVPTLYAPSDNGISGTWNPSAIDNQKSGTYTFTPAAGQCASSVTFSVTVTPNVTPVFSFGASQSYCAGGAVPVLPGTSNNGINGTWSPAAVDNMNSGVYSFTPSAGQCALTTTFTVTINPVVTPSFAFGNSLTICSGAAVPALPGTSTNGITGTWSPATISNTTSGTYTFLPGGSQCAVGFTLTVNVNPVIIPTFAFGSSLTICSGATVPVLYNPSDNGISGSWNPSTVSNTASATYTFTPTPGQCAATTTFSVTVNPNITPTFNFGTLANICAGGAVPVLANTSNNGITGTWSPATVDNQNSATYTFTPNAAQCATTTTFTVTVSPNITPAFSFGNAQSYCAGTTVPSLPVTSTNGITGSWNPAAVDNQTSAVYTFTPAAGQCATSVTFTVTINPNTIPVFSFGTSLNICAGGGVPVLPTTSDNGIDGTWNPAVVSNLNSGTYIFTPNIPPGQCITTSSFKVTVNPNVTPTFSFGAAMNLCAGAAAPALPTVSTNGIIGTWSPATIDNVNAGTYTFTPNAGQCSTGAVNLTVSIIAVPSLGTSHSDTTVVDGSLLPLYDPRGTPAGINFNWINSNPSIGLAASGSGPVPSFTGKNLTANPITGTITVTPVNNGCSGLSQKYIITVLPLNKDIFVPTVFSPNGDGKNDLLYAYSNYIVKLEMRIFNQWGQEIMVITDKNQAWDGRYKGKAQPVGVYAYALQALMTDGRTIKMKGSVTLLR